MLSSHTQEQIATLAKSLGLYVYDIEWLKDNNEAILRISITRKAPNEYTNATNSAISLQDCENLSALISPLLDVEEINLTNYRLEVSSPGLERILKNLKHFAFSLGENVSVKMADKSVIEGILSAVNDEYIIIKSKQKSIEIAFKDIKKARVIFEF